MSNRTPLIAGNWKMNLDHRQAIAFAQKLHWSLKDTRHDYARVEVAIFPPFTDLRSIQTLFVGDKYDLVYGAQDVSAQLAGAFTGEISGAFLSALECRYVIVGHSERRELHHESDEVIAAKAAAAASQGLIPIICVGETAEDLEKHGPSAVPVAQLERILSDLSPETEIVVAYEPVWAIGSGQAATPDQAETVAQALRGVTERALGAEAAARTRILYGGSVNSSNIAGYMRRPNVDGALVGGASLKVDEFSRIVRYLDHVGV